VPSALVHEDSHASLSNGLLVAQGDLSATGSACLSAHVRIVILVHHALLERQFFVLVDLLLDDVLVEDLIVKLQRLFVDQLVVQAFAVSWLNDVRLRVDGILVSFLSRCLVLTLELFLLFHSVRVVLNETLGRRDFEFANTAIVKFIDRLIESLWVNVLTLSLKLGVKLGKLVLDSFCFHLEFFVVESMLRLTVNTILNRIIRVVEWHLSSHSVLDHLSFHFISDSK